MVSQLLLHGPLVNQRGPHKELTHHFPIYPVFVTFIRRAAENYCIEFLQTRSLMHVHLGAKRHQLTRINDLSIDLITRRLLGATTEKINLAFSCFFTFDGHVIMHVRHGNVFFHL